MLSAKLPGTAPGPRKRYLVALAPDAVRLYALPKGSSPGDPDPDPDPDPNPDPDPDPSPSPNPNPNPNRAEAAAARHAAEDPCAELQLPRRAAPAPPHAALCTFLPALVGAA